MSYFGEDVPEGGCERCDACQDGIAAGGTARNRPLDDHEFTVVRKILSGIARVRGRCGRQRLVQMLTGSRAQPIVDRGFDRLSTFGLLRGMKKEMVLDIIDQLEVAECIRQSGDRYPVLHLSDLGLRVMKAETTIELAMPSPGHRSWSGTQSASSRVAADVDVDYDDELFQRLRHVRRGIADELGVPAYRVFSDRTLKVMSSEKPKTEDELLGVPGVGAVTLEKFGRPFLAEIAGEAPPSLEDNSN